MPIEMTNLNVAKKVTTTITNYIDGTSQKEVRHEESISESMAGIFTYTVPPTGATDDTLIHLVANAQTGTHITRAYRQDGTFAPLDSFSSDGFNAKVKAIVLKLAADIKPKK